MLERLELSNTDPLYYKTYQVKKAYRDVAPNEKVEELIGFYPRRAGSTKLVVRSI